MSNNESFIDEVNEQVQNDKFYALLKRYGWIGIVAVVVVVGGTAYREYSNAQSTAAAQALGDSLMNGLELSEPADRSAALAAIDADGATAAIPAMLHATQAVDADDVAGAIASLESVAANGDVDEVYRDIAGFKLLMLQGADMSPADRKAAFEIYAVPGTPLRLLAMEQMVLADVDAGETEAALAGLTAILEDAGLGLGLKRRSENLVTALGGTVPDALN
ncbi:tetratricopeptide repeat protein [Aestuariibius sp. HNIBRBA575]|uniref:tetratricopeptide repeat protein n=1 Tax=Aestuariibius sp. HNIBRBA575 TaxID=3233343 RepID=UPI0034A2EB27